MSRMQAKVVMLGEGRVGKTSLVLRFCKDTFSDSQPPTIQASFLDKPMTVGDKRVNLAIWDTAGQERFHALGPIYYRDADAALLVYDITDPDSFTKVQTWVKELRKMVRRCHAECSAPASIRGPAPGPDGTPPTRPAAHAYTPCAPPPGVTPGGKRDRAVDSGQQVGLGQASRGAAAGGRRLRSLGGRTLCRDVRQNGPRDQRALRCDGQETARDAEAHGGGSGGRWERLRGRR